MEKYYSATMILLIAACFLLPASLQATEYQHTLKSGDIQFSWTIEGEKIHVELSAKTTGWLGVGFDPEDAMEGANIIIGAVKDGKVRIEDHYGDRKRGHSSDEDLGGNNDVIDPAGTEKDGVTTISFTYPLDTGGTFDKVINPEGTSRIMLAYGAGRPSFKSRHPYRSVYEVNYTTGESRKIK